MTFTLDNQAIFNIASNAMFYERINHVETDYYFIRENIVYWDITTYYVNTNDQLLDAFTKSLSF